MDSGIEDTRFRELCTSAGLAIIATDDQSRVRFWNGAARRIFGRSAEEIIGEPILSVVPEERQDLVRRLLERALEKGEVSEFEVHHSDGPIEEAYLAVTLSPIVTDQGKRVGVSVCISDVTRGMKLLRDVAEAQRMSALSTMAGAVAHHFNNLLGGVLTSIDFALATDDPAVLRRALRTTVSALSRANDLTVNLLSFAEGDRSPSSPEDAARTVNHFVESVAPRLAESQVKLETDVLAVTPIVPAKQLLTILDCLETNATEAMPDGGTLRIELLPGPGHSLVLRVSDTGPGIPRDQLPYVFEPFFTTKRGGPPNDTMHAGLGLAVVHGLVKDLGGVVTVGPAEGGGTICTVCLPGEGIRDPL